MSPGPIFECDALMSQTYPHLFGTSLSITDHQIKALNLIVISSIISLLSFFVQNPNASIFNILVFLIQFFAGIALLIGTNGAVTNNDYKFIAYVISQFLFTIAQSFTASGAIAFTTAVILTALLQAFLNIYGLLEGEWQTDIPSSVTTSGSP